MVNTGKLKLHEELKSSVFPRPHRDAQNSWPWTKRIKALYKALDAKTIGELEYACLANRLVELQGFGQKTQGKILQGIQLIKKYQGQYLYEEVIEPAEEILRKILSAIFLCDFNWF